MTKSKKSSYKYVYIITWAFLTMLIIIAMIFAFESYSKHKKNNSSNISDNDIKPSILPDNTNPLEVESPIEDDTETDETTSEETTDNSVTNSPENTIPQPTVEHSNLVQAFDSIGVSTSIEPYLHIINIYEKYDSVDNRYATLHKITTNILGNPPVLCYKNPSSDTEYDTNISEITKQAIKKGLQTYKYEDVAAVGLLYLSLLFDFDSSDFVVVKNDRGATKYIKIKNPDNPNVFLKLSEYMNIIKNTVSTTEFTESTRMSTIVPLIPGVTSTIEFDSEQIENMIKRRKDNIFDNLNKERDTDKINIVAFSKILSIYISKAIFPGKCSILEPPKIVKK